jgi:selenocysteine lyase/cysteine desulfurase
MTLSRRQALGAAIAMPLAAQSARAAQPAASMPISLPDKASFAATPIAYFDSASTHPVSLGAKAAADAYLGGRTLDPAASAKKPVDRAAVLARFAALVHADPDEVTWVQSTTMGEQAVLRALGYPHRRGRIVTDTLHFYASFPMYQEMAKQGVDVAWVKARDGRIPMEDMARAITPGTTLVCVSQVSTYNGFEHDLKAICDLAHAAGALVYADIIHAAGAVPVDLHGSGVDFAACATYKWLMGDFGLGFLYARRGIGCRTANMAITALPRLTPRPVSACRRQSPMSSRWTRPATRPPAMPPAPARSAISAPALMRRRLPPCWIIACPTLRR